MKRKEQIDGVGNGFNDNRSMKRTRSSNQKSSAAIVHVPNNDASSTPRAKESRDRAQVAAEKENIPGSEGSGEERESSSVPDDESVKQGQSESQDDEVVDGNSPVRPRLSPIKPQNQTPKSVRYANKLFATPTKAIGITGTDETPRLRRNIDRSARRKSTRTLIERTILGNTSDNDDEEEDIANQIYDSEEDDDLAAEEDQGGIKVSETVDDPSTPSKRGRDRIKGSKVRQRSPTPPQDLAPHELYFSQNRPGRTKTANSNLASLALLDHEEYFKLSRDYKDQHAEDMVFLQDVHARSFNQWQFELSENFNICIYGWGSKRSLLLKFAEHIYKAMVDHNKDKIVIINGYVQTLTVRDVLNTVASAVSGSGTKLGSQPAEMLDTLIALLEEDETRHITLIIHSIDGAPMRRPATQMILSRLSAHSQIRMVASADHPSFPLLWDSSLRAAFNFLFHDCTTFLPYDVEIDVVDEVHELLGRTGRKVGGKGGVSFVLKSLPENAKSLFRVLIGEQIASMDEHSVNEHEHDNDDEVAPNGNGIGNRRNRPGVEYRVLYQKAVEEFICSNEMNFRTLLKEFHDHQMIESRKDALGTEILCVPFRKEELENILEDIAS